MGVWNNEQIPHQSGRTVVVTGANSGLGYFTARALAIKGARVIMACRDREKGERAREEILSEKPGLDLAVRELDLANLISVRTFSERFLTDNKGPDLLINNAGLMAIPYRKTADGFEMQFGVNHLGHFALTALLWPGISSRKDARIVNVSSAAHRFGKIRFRDIHWETHYSKWGAYGMSKLANLLFTHELARRLSEAGTGVKVASAHPGYADTSLQAKGALMEGAEWKARSFNRVNRLFAQPASMGALPTLFASVAPVVEQGGFYGPGGFMRMRGWPSPERPDPRRVNERIARELWKISEKMTGIEFRVN